ncbi:MAG: hypothetical protein ACI4I1_10000 [Oscillospiraceae bacterium]
MSNKKYTPDELVDAEIERLNKSPAVQIARKEKQIIYRRRQYLYSLRCLEKRGKELIADGWTIDTLELLLQSIQQEET